MGHNPKNSLNCATYELLLLVYHVLRLLILIYSICYICLCHNEALSVQTIVEHQLRMQNFGMDYQLLSNDNAFLSYHPFPFTQRTLLARFQVNSTDPPHFQFIRKPIYSVMALLSLIGGDQVQVQPTLQCKCCSFGLICFILCCNSVKMCTTLLLWFTNSFNHRRLSCFDETKQY